MSLVDDTDALQGGDGEAMPASQDQDAATKPAYARLAQWINDPNIAKDLQERDPSLLDAIGERVMREYRIDDNSRADWKDKAGRAMKAMMQDGKPKQYPWPGASN